MANTLSVIFYREYLMIKNLLLLLLMPTFSYAEGLQCPSQNSEFETYLCNSYQIAALDKELNSIYVAALDE